MKDSLDGEEERAAAHHSLVRVCEDADPVEGPRYKVGWGGGGGGQKTF